MRIALLHTIEGNQQIFDDAASSLGLPVENLHHEVRSDLREAVQRAGTLPADIMAQTKQRLLTLAAGSDAVILTCATLGAAADAIESAPVPIVRADAALAAAAGKAGNLGGKIVVLCAVESAVEPNRRLFAQHVSDAATSVEVVHIAPAWTLFSNREFEACFAAIAASADAAYEAGATVVAFAHPWMAPAVRLARKGQPLDSATVALRKAMQPV
ncbi:arylsulfatase [Paraburkholderia sp. BCC1884]|uniref:arylsulfatase n=1 Tax=Paraburkholderia sp. BCC1884 TaxID=2562668 RepID=UPI0011844746|nr:arylsulfatase [Paraburkholderia sp. BCC1884]